MVIFQIDVGGVLAVDVEGQAIASCHPGRPASLAIAFELVQPIAGQRHRLGQRTVAESQEHALELVREPSVDAPRAPGRKQGSEALVAKPLDHVGT